MEFKTDQGRDAYKEVVAETGRAAESVLVAARDLSAKNFGESISIMLSATRAAAEIRIDGLNKAIKLGVHIDAEWSSLKAHVAMCGQR